MIDYQYFVCLSLDLKSILPQNIWNNDHQFVPLFIISLNNNICSFIHLN